MIKLRPAFYLTFCLGISASGISIQSANATPINKAATGIASADVTVDFELGSLPAFTVVTNQFASQGIIFDGSVVISTGGAFPNLPGRFLNENGTANRVMTFDQDLSAISFQVRTDDVFDTLFEAFLDGNLVESFFGDTTLVDANNFFGFENIVFDEIVIRGQAVDGVNIDTVEFTYALSEPSGLAVMGLGLLALGYAGRRKAA